MVISLLKSIFAFIKCKFSRIEYKDGVWISPSSKISRGTGSISISRKVSIHSNCNLTCYDHANIVINEGTNLNVGNRIVAQKGVILGQNIITGPYVFISDNNNEYRNIDIPICRQGHVACGKGINIGDDCWIGFGAAIIGNVHIGKHCVIGANSVVTKDIPDYSVAVGAPAKVVKKYNSNTKQWDRVL